MPLRFTIFGLTLSSAWGNGHATPWRAILRALHRLGHEITFFEKDVEYYAFRRDLPACNFCDLHLYPDWDSVRRLALRHARESDVVILTSYCPEGARISDEIFGLAHPVKIYYDLDTPITLKQFESAETPYIRRNQIRDFDLALSFTGGPALDTLQNRYHARAVLPLYGCVDPATHFRVPPRDEFTCDLSYMGTYAPDRQQKLDDLFLEPARRSVEKQFLLAGTLYPWSWVWPQNVRRFDHIAPGDHSALYSSSRCTLNITRAEMAANGYCPSGRFFEAAACGAPILTDSWPGLEDFFKPGEEVIIVQNADDVMSCLNGDQRELAQLAARARERTLDQHTGAIRARQLLSYIEDVAGLNSHAAALELAS